MRSPIPAAIVRRTVIASLRSPDFGDILPADRTAGDDYFFLPLLAGRRALPDREAFLCAFPLEPRLPAGMMSAATERAVRAARLLSRRPWRTAACAVSTTVVVVAAAVSRRLSTASAGLTFPSPTAPAARRTVRAAAPTV